VDTQADLERARAAIEADAHEGAGPRAACVSSDS